MHDKQAKLEAAARALDRRAPQPLLLASDPKRARAYDWAAGSGSVGGRTVWLDNQLRAGRAGVRMYCVLLPDDGVQALLVDAGWWPLDASRTLPVFGCPLGRGVAVRGLLAPPPSSGLARGDALAAAGPQRWLATRLDLAVIARELKLSTGIAARAAAGSGAQQERCGRDAGPGRARPRHPAEHADPRTPPGLMPCSGSGWRWRCWLPPSSSPCATRKRRSP
ncbi:SURF1 family cytochrome oxidase biogenesis protein [Thermomonas sp.]|uniref:SURF1 family cytochrome oxidase biogenesis protein n=1 Tax=Thermomonas sp. TaxID=1971895 RepID=UPI002616DD64|nr:SURF1 family cytochrome oxidase biogenesis protein [Thermomonas sp.]